MQIRITGTEVECAEIGNLLEQHYCKAKSTSEFYPTRRRAPKSVEGRVYISFDKSPRMGKPIKESKHK